MKTTTYAELQARAAAAQFVFYSLSGGRDSVTALYATLDEYRRSGKRIEALYVNGGNELPSVTQHVHKVCEMLEVPLRILPGKRYADVYRDRHPDSIHMDCVERLINKPIDDYCRGAAEGHDYILVRGGRASQKRPESGTRLYQVVKSKPHMIIHNPLFASWDGELPEELVWPGYAQGFVRTACYCCPFQRPEHWEALAREYPALHAHMKRLLETVPFVLHPGDGHVKYIADYWIKSQMTPVKLQYCAGREKVVAASEYEIISRAEQEMLRE